MPIYNVQVNMSGTLRVQAESEELASDIAVMGTPMVSGKSLFDATIRVTPAKELDTYVLQPNDMTQASSPAGV